MIRSYSLDELVSVFHGPDDPDQAETPALRPVSTLLYWFQGIVFGDNVVFQRIFLSGLMVAFLFTVGLLLRELSLSAAHVAVVLVLFTCSRVFTSLMLWITCSSLILCYIFMVLSAVFYLRFVERNDSKHLLVVSLGFATLATFIREEAYTLPAVLPLLWLLSRFDPKNRTIPSHCLGRAAAGSIAAALVMALHFSLRSAFVPDAPQASVSLGRLWPSLHSAWLPGGRESLGQIDLALKVIWTSFTAVLVVLFLYLGSKARLAQFFGFCVVGVILCTPALGVPRAFGIAMPSLAFFSAISVAIVEIHQRIFYERYRQRFWKPVILSIFVLGIEVGAAAGIRRSLYVAEALNENSAERAVYNGEFVFVYGLPSKHVTIPAERREAELARLAKSGVRSRDDFIELINDPQLFIANHETTLFRARYNYLSF